MLVFFLYFLVSVLVIIFLLIILEILSTLEIEIKNIDISNKNKVNNEALKVKIKLKIFNIKWFSITLKRDDIYKLLFKFNIKRIVENKDNIKDDLKAFLEAEDIRKTIKEKLKIDLNKLDLNISFGFEDYIITSYIIAFISTVISIILSKFNKVDIKNSYYKVTPIYKQSLNYNFNLDCIISAKIGNIIYIIFLSLKRRSDKNDKRSSNRKFNEYSYE